MDELILDVTQNFLFIALILEIPTAYFATLFGVWWGERIASKK